ncbi:monoglyceride lipase-like [Dysidea avara]|uniref:monoglyceride lipase-like n=1 Tax=Dysidea avara TaxID=196820 RepID=UPI00331F82A8
MASIMAVNQSDFFRNADNQKIFVRGWVPGCDPIAVLYIVHGVAEHSGRYENLAVFLNENEIAVYSQDLVGHGKSDGDRVHIEDVQIYVRDVIQHIEIVKAKYSSDIPFFIMGHSMGGLVTTLFTIQRPDLIKGMVLSAPGIAYAAGILMRGFVRAVALVAPQLIIYNSDINDLSRDQDEICAYLEDPLTWKGGVKARWAVAIFDAQLQVAEGISTIKLPFITLHGTDDTMVDISSSQFLMDNAQSEDKTFECFQDGRHRLFSDLEHDRFKQVVIDWLKKHITSPQ